MTDRFNRLVLGALGVIVAVVAAIGLLARDEAIDLRQPRALYRDAAREAAAERNLWGGVAIAGALLLAALGLLWAWRQIRSPRDGVRLSTVELARTPRGATTLAPVAAARALADDIESLPGVVGSRVRLMRWEPRPALIAWMDLQADADPLTVRAAAEEPLDRLCQALAVDGVVADFRLRPTAATVTSRVQ